MSKAQRDEKGRFQPGNTLSVGNQGGAPTKYDPERHPQLGKRLAELGLKDDEIAMALDISLPTLYNWRSKHPEFLEAVTVDAKAAFDKRIERSLALKALGYEIDEEKVFFPSGSKDPVKVTVKKHVPASDTAAIFWLKNRRPDVWRDRQDFRVSSGDGAQQIDTEALEMLVLSQMKDVTPSDDTSAGLDDDNPEETEG